MNDTSLVIGCGLDYFFKTNIYLTVVALYTYDFAPNPSKNVSPIPAPYWNRLWRQYQFCGEVGFGFKF